jgi:hypothetical protein
MARKVVNRKELRDEAEAAERLGAGDKKAAKPKADGEKPKRKSRAKVVKEVRLRALWGVFNQSLKRVAVFEYSQRAEADKKAKDLSESQRSPHFVQLVKEKIE